ncbi:Uncharacterized protein TCM_004012 [Theobroma cacao]|uniref:CCHC-type domain-containing protein n=1 Tax=Theobroma cacao TaxID=3641 RepID=A0A061DWP1_THECC|nr:Uncharacterized protein TCM_004012 [Theobroma cacao]
MTMIPITTPLEKGQSMGRPYLFTSENYPYWKRRIDMFIQAHDTNVRTVILEGPYVPIKTVDHSEREKELKEKKKQQAKGITLKVTLEDDEKNIKSDEEGKSDEITLITRKFNRFLRNKQRSRITRPFRRNTPKEGLRRDTRRDIIENDHGRDHIICYECGKPGHIKYDCSNVKKIHSKNLKRKPMMAAWSDSDESQSEENEEITNICFMALEEHKVHSNSYALSLYELDDDSYTFEELQDDFHELALEFECMILKHKNIISKLKSENEFLTKIKIE